MILPLCSSEPPSDAISELETPSDVISDLFTLSDAIIDLDTYSLFNERKVVLCKNCIFLSSSKSEIDHDIEILEKYLTCLQEINNIEESFDGTSSANTELKKCLNSFEFYEFVAKLIGDFKFQYSINYL